MADDNLNEFLEAALKRKPLSDDPEVEAVRAQQAGDDAKKLTYLSGVETWNGAPAYAAIDQLAAQDAQHQAGGFDTSSDDAYVAIKRRAREAALQKLRDPNASLDDKERATADAKASERAAMPFLDYQKRQEQPKADAAQAQLDQDMASALEKHRSDAGVGEETGPLYEAKRWAIAKLRGAQ